MKFSKYHALGNDYLIIDPRDSNSRLTDTDVKTICDRHYGVGADGILLGPEKSETSDFFLRIFNPDASEAEISGNGLRIFARYLWDQSLVSHEEFTIRTKGGAVSAAVGENGFSVSIKMGKVRFTHESAGTPVIKPAKINLKGREFIYYLAHIGNPHCVIFIDEITESYAKEYGAMIENDSRFSDRTNVQFARVIDRTSIQMEIWERGAGYTLASGSSSTAAASVAHALGYCDSSVDVHMPGGVINIKIDGQSYATMTGPVQKICEGSISTELFGSPVR